MQGSVFSPKERTSLLDFNKPLPRLNAKGGRVRWHKSIILLTKCPSSHKLKYLTTHMFSFFFSLDQSGAPWSKTMCLYWSVAAATICLVSLLKRWILPYATKMTQGYNNSSVLINGIDRKGDVSRTFSNPPIHLVPQFRTIWWSVPGSLGCHF